MPIIVKKSFLDRVVREGLIDTRKYRYVAHVYPAGGIMVRRIPLAYLDTTAALDRKNWELVGVLWY